jgi:hypothetical protein
MYCPSCGVAVAQGLRFCNYCGARLSSSNPGAEPREVKPETVIGAMAFVFIFGLFAISLLILLLSDGVHLGPAQIMGFTAISLLIMAALEAVFITLLFRRKRRPKETDETNQLPQPITKELHAPPDRVVAELPDRSLAEMPDRGFAGSVPSVTEHTTRAFDSVYGEQVKK